MGETTNPAGEKVQTPAGEGGQTPQQTPVLTPEQQALLVKANAALTNAGRLEAELKRSQSVATAALSRLKQMEESELHREEEAARDDPAKLTAVQAKRQALSRAAEIETERQRIETERTELQTQRQEIREYRAEKLSAQYNVDPQILLKYGGDTKDSMEVLAKSFGERKAQTGETGTQGKPPPPHNDSGANRGGSDRIGDLPPAQWEQALKKKLKN